MPDLSLGPVVTRFAPSPTGWLHLGHAAHMLYVWGIADLLQGEVLLRVEDHDRQRCKARFEEALLVDMEWLGFRVANRLVASSSSYRQSDADSTYEEAVNSIRRDHQVYRCRCSRKQLATTAHVSSSGERVYPGTCRGAKHTADAPHGLRVAWAADAPPEEFADGLLGFQCQKPERQCGDLLIKDRFGNWTYQFAVTVDDWRHGVNVVVRGSDILASTGRQIRLARMLGRDVPPVFFHHPLVSDSGGVKLSKKQRATPIRELRKAGMSPAEVLGAAAQAVGLQAESRSLEPSEVGGLVGTAHPGLLARARQGLLGREPEPTG